MKWIKVNNYDEMSRCGAERLFAVISRKIQAGQKVNIGLATGNTMIKLYAMLAEMLNLMRLRCHRSFLPPHAQLGYGWQNSRSIRVYYGF